LNVRIVSLSLLVLCLAVVPAIAQTDLYDNGPINGTVDSWTINFGFAVSDSFTLSGNSQVNGLSFGAWMFPGDTLVSAEVAITSSEFGGTSYFDQSVNFTASGCVTNQMGYNVCTETGSFAPVNLNAGTYWLTLENACCTDDPLYWDENSGPSSASENQVGTIPSESFTLVGNGTTSSTSSGSSTPEPGSIMLFGSGILGVAGILRRKLF
jgi:PEP-CTERM motif-containing protein